MSEHEPRSLREELEIRVIALLTGELPEADADELEKILSVDPELSDFRDRMATLMGDVHTARDEISPPEAQPPMRLSDERRREIFGETENGDIEPTPKEKKWWHLGLLEIAAMFILAGVLAAILIPSVGAVRMSSEEAAARADARQREMESAFFGEKAPQEQTSASTREMSPQMVQSPSAAPTRQRRIEKEEMKQWASSGDVSLGSGEYVKPEMEDIEVSNLNPSLSRGFGGSADYKKDKELRERAFQDESNLIAMDQIESNQRFGDGSDQGALTGYVQSAPVDAFAAAPSQPAPARSGPVDPFAAPSAAAEPKPRATSGSGEIAMGAFSSSGVAEPVIRGERSKQVARDESSGRKMGYDMDASEGAEVRTRSEMLAMVDQAWERPKVFESGGQMVADLAMGGYVDKLNQIVIPQVNFSGMPISKVIETLEELSVEYDPERRGVEITYIEPADGADPRVNISLRNLNLDRILQFVTQQTNFSYDRQDDRVFVQSGARSPVELAAIARNELTRQTPKAEKSTRESPVSTFSLNVSDVSFKLAQAALSTQRIPAAELIRTEEFVNSFDYGDPTPRENEPVTLNWEIAQHPFAHNRQVVRFSLQTQAAGRAANQPLNLNLLIDNSGSMQRPDRRAILEKSLESLQAKLTDRDRLNIVLFARQPKLIANATNVREQKSAIERTLNYQPEGGTNLEAGLKVAYEVAGRSYDPAASNRVILMTDGAANLGDVDSSNLAQTVIAQRTQGIALDAYGIGWEDYNDALLEEITRNGDGRYAFLNSVDTAAEDFAEKLAGTLRVGAADVKVQIIWNPERVTTYRQIGYDLHQLREQDFRDNTVDAAEIGEAESGTALYVLQIKEDSDASGALGKLQVRYRVPATGEYVERAWPLEMPHRIPALSAAPASLRLAASSAFFAERLADNPYAGNYSFEDLEALTRDLPNAFPTQPRVVALQNMIQTANALFTGVE